MMMIWTEAKQAGTRRQDEKKGSSDTAKFKYDGNMQRIRHLRLTIYNLPQWPPNRALKLIRDDRVSYRLMNRRYSSILSYSEY
jgi:hypothetical protein